MLQVIANTIRPGCNHQQLIDFYPNVEIALMDTWADLLARGAKPSTLS